MEKFKITPAVIFFAVFIAVEAIIYITFNILSATLPNDPIFLKYAGVLLCLAASGAAIFFYRKSKDAVIVTCAFIATAISDLFILVLDDYYEVGLVTFLITQSVYLYRLYRDRMDRVKITLIVRAIAAGLLLAVIEIIAGLNFLLVEVCVYIVMLVGNVIDAVIICVRKGRTLNGILFAAGLFLFLCCDICVGLDNAATFVPSLDLGSAGRTVNFLIWVFYLPSQALIALSVSRNGLTLLENKNERKEQENT